ncbi:hypothetical protein HDE_13309 [Halotydeus destructor]|nr:hypothetical protein HDE_13309 [Halotydeus destructor]
MTNEVNPSDISPEALNGNGGDVGGPDSAGNGDTKPTTKGPQGGNAYVSQNKGDYVPPPPKGLLDGFGQVFKSKGNTQTHSKSSAMGFNPGWRSEPDTNYKFNSSNFKMKPPVFNFDDRRCSTPLTSGNGNNIFSQQAANNDRMEQMMQLMQQQMLTMSTTINNLVQQQQEPQQSRHRRQALRNPGNGQEDGDHNNGNSGQPNDQPGDQSDPPIQENQQQGHQPIYNVSYHGNPEPERRESRCSLPKYNGKSQYEEWINNAILLLEINEVPQDRWKSKMAEAFEGPALNKFAKMADMLHEQGKRVNELSTRDFLNSLEQIMDDTIERPMALQAIKEIKQGWRETATDYIKRFKKLTKNVRLSDEVRINYLVLGLEAQLSDRILLTSNNGATLTAANIESKIELAEEYLKHHRKQVRAQERYSSRNSTDRKTESKTKTKPKKEVCKYCEKPGHSKEDCHARRRDRENKRDKSADRKSTKERTKAKELEVHSESNEDSSDSHQGNESAPPETSEEDSEQ